MTRTPPTMFEKRSRGSDGSGLHVLVFILAGLLAIPACSGQQRATSNVALQPGEANYPAQAISQKQTIQFTAIVPDGLSPEFHVIYHVEWQQDERDPTRFTSPSGCAWKQEVQFYVNMPLKLTRVGNTYAGSFSPDVFEPGPCGWHMTEMTSPMVRSGVVYFGHSLHTDGHPFPELDLTTQVVHIWCTRRGKDQSRHSTILNELIDCTPFQMIETFTKLPPGFDASVPAKEKLWNIHFTQYLRSLTVEFHDLDALIPAYLAAHASTSPVQH